METHRVTFFRTVAATLLWAGAGVSVLAFADGLSQPDPPIPAEAAPRYIAAAGPVEPDCRCGVLRARDIESRVDGHVAQWEALPHASDAERANAVDAGPLRLTTFVEGVVGFPVRQFRLAADRADTTSR